jgi:hypothetical protein
MEIGKSYRVDNIIYQLNEILNFPDGSSAFIFSNEEDELIVTSYRKLISSPYERILRWEHIMSDAVIEV